MICALQILLQRVPRSTKIEQLVAIGFSRQEAKSLTFGDAGTVAPVRVLARKERP